MLEPLLFISVNKNVTQSIVLMMSSLVFLRVPVINFDASRSESNSSNLYLPTLAVKQAGVVDKGWTFFLRLR